MKALLRVCAQVAALAAAGCCTGGSAAAPTPAEPVLVEGPLPECLAYCARSLACHAERGSRPGEGENDCQTACAPGGMHAVLTPATWACSTQDACDDFWACATLGMMQRLVGSLDTATPAEDRPPNWPVGFPILPGGTVRPAPPMGPVHVAVVAYAGRPPAELAEAYRSALSAAGWMIPPGSVEQTDDAVRFVALRAGTSVSVSLYDEDDQTYVQTMQLGAALFGH